MKVVMFDYGVGNLHSLSKALARHGAQVEIVDHADHLDSARAVVLPGVGAFGAAAERLAKAAPVIRTAVEDGLPCLGICLGMQLLLDASAEGTGAGLGIIPGQVRRLEATRIPHMGWNEVIPDVDPLFAGLEKPVAYFANSFVVSPTDPKSIIAWTEYEGQRFPAAVRRRRAWGVQFHPEKSGGEGLRLLDNFMAEVAR